MVYHGNVEDKNFINKLNYYKMKIYTIPEMIRIHLIVFIL